MQYHSVLELGHPIAEDGSHFITMAMQSWQGCVQGDS